MASVAAPRVFPLHTGVATVTAIRRVTPSMACFTLQAPAFSDPGVEQPGEILTLGWPNDGEPLVLPEGGWRFPPGAGIQHWRNFTVRRANPERSTVDVDFYLHGDVGRASAWAELAGVGDEVGFAGPRVHWAPDPRAEWSLLVADETGVPALLAILESLPAGMRAIAIAEVSCHAERQEASTSADAEVHWVTREGGPPGTTTALVDCLRGLALPGEQAQAWGGGEALAMRDVRRHLAAEHPSVAGSMSILGYWKHRATPDDVN